MERLTLHCVSDPDTDELLVDNDLRNGKVTVWLTGCEVDSAPEVGDLKRGTNAVQLNVDQVQDLIEHLQRLISGPLTNLVLDGEGKDKS